MLAHKSIVQLYYCTFRFSTLFCTVSCLEFEHMIIIINIMQDNTKMADSEIV